MELINLEHINQFAIFFSFTVTVYLQNDTETVMHI